MGQLEEVAHPARPSADLDDVAALHSGRGDLDWLGYLCAAERPLPHFCTSAGVDWLDAAWHGQSHTS
ncbi:hypothetical protein [Streptomyces sp. NPDC058295]|uniref:hypothetical protein n=1 Tax=Streptomyces sp. NPDC058295 TaxID=3346431 RepID=UPI0036EA2A4C